MRKKNRKRWEVLNIFIKRYGLRRGAELGTYDGVCALNLVRANPKLHLYTVDAFDLPVPKPKTRSTNERCQCNHCLDMRARRKAYNHAGFDGSVFEDQLRGVIAEEKLSSRLHIIKGLTAPAAAHITNNSLDFIFVDGGHSYEMVNADLVAWYPKLRRGGFIFGHDWNMTSVRKAACDYLKPAPRPLHNDHVWFHRVKA